MGSGRTGQAQTSQQYALLLGPLGVAQGLRVHVLCPSRQVHQSKFRSVVSSAFLLIPSDFSALSVLAFFRGHTHSSRAPFSHGKLCSNGLPWWLSS